MVPGWYGDAGPCGGGWNPGGWNLCGGWCPGGAACGSGGWCPGGAACGSGGWCPGGGACGNGGWCPGGGPCGNGGWCPDGGGPCGNGGGPSPLTAALRRSCPCSRHHLHRAKAKLVHHKVQAVVDGINLGPLIVDTPHGPVQLSLPVCFICAFLPHCEHLGETN